MSRKSLKERILDAEVHSSQWLADGNQAREAGDKVRADECYRKSQFWLDRYNLLTNGSHKAGPKA